MFAVYFLSSGIIQSTMSQPLANSNQLAALGVAGYGIAEVPDDVNGSNAIIDLDTGKAIKYNNAPPPVPNIIVQYIAAQINAGVLSAAAFHPVTLTEMNAQLSASNMNTVAAAGVQAVVKGPTTVG